MSNALAIATVTETLAQMIGNCLAGSNVGAATVSKTRPDDTTNLAAVGVNVFLYQISPNAAWRNADLPTRAADGSLLCRPQVAIDLHYLITFHGNDQTLEQQRLLGAVVRQLHAVPVLSRAAITSALSTLAANATIPNYLAGSDLADQIELVRFTPTNFSLEELSKLWSFLLKTDYVLSVAYSASVVLIETDVLPPAPALPVLKPVVGAFPFSLTVIDSVTPQAVEISSPPAVSQITLTGQNLGAANAVAFFTPGNPNPIPGNIGSYDAAQNAMVIDLPSGLRSGVNGVMLTKSSPESSPPDPARRILAQSNTAAFVIQPTVTLTLSASQQITAVISPPPGPNQKVTLVLNPIDHSPPDAPSTFELAGSLVAGQVDTVVFSTSFTPVGADQVLVKSGSYMARVRVDSAQSQLDVGPSGTFTGPILTIP